ncbi:MAG TPA: mannosyl-3-phosphoglycerate phosphatase, partial [Gammaproteobacteria bacterium]|nr:mannosyl-3-phosphoglycerate phosphatase [Gammaproteobacteria bacterium]
MTDRQLLVFTDLDGTLLDHHTYRFQAASPALERLREAGIPV